MRRRLAVLAAPVLAASVVSGALAVAADGPTTLVGKSSVLSSGTAGHQAAYAKPAGRRWN